MMASKADCEACRAPQPIKTCKGRPWSRWETLVVGAGVSETIGEEGWEEVGTGR